MSHWPQYTLLALYLLGVGVDVSRHGTPKTGRHNVAMTLVALAISLGLQWAGGFYAGVFG